MELPVMLPITPMLAKAVTWKDMKPLLEKSNFSFEPKWDGFRCIVLRDGDDVQLASRGSKPLTRYFPELVDAVREHLPQRLSLIHI